MNWKKIFENLKEIKSAITDFMIYIFIPICIVLLITAGMLYIYLKFN